MRGRARILYVANNPAYFREHWLPFAEGAGAAGAELHLAAPRDAWGDAGLADRSVAALEARGLTFHPLFMTRSRALPWEEARTLARLVSLYRELAPDLVHHVTFKPIAHGGVAARLTGVPAAVNSVTGLGHKFTAGGIAARLSRALMRAGYRISFGHRNQVAAFENPEDRDRFVAEGLVSADRAVATRGVGVDAERFSPSPEPETGPERPPVALYAGRMLETKGVPELVEAARRLEREGTPARVVLVGAPDPGNEASVPEARLREWARKGAVEWWGRREEMPEVLGGSHVVCLPSHREGLPRLLLEAGACARPVVATDVPGCREVVRDRENGLLVPPRDPEALADALRRLLEDPELRRRMGRRGREIVCAAYTEEAAVGDMLGIYERVLGEGRRG